MLDSCVLALLVGRCVEGVRSVLLPIDVPQKTALRHSAVASAAWESATIGRQHRCAEAHRLDPARTIRSLGAVRAVRTDARRRRVRHPHAPVAQHGPALRTLTLLTGGEVVVLPRFSPEAFVHAVDAHRATWAVAVPTMLHRTARLLQNGAVADLSSLDAIAVGASACAQSLKEFWADRLGPQRMIEFYSTTENQVVVIANGYTWRAHPGAVGRVVLGEIEVRDEHGRAVAEGEVGELWMRRGCRRTAPYRYIGAEPQRDADGWDSVGDLGSIRDGHVYLVDRLSDMIIVGGSNVYRRRWKPLSRSIPRTVVLRGRPA